jgi:NAD+ kinase
MPGPKPPAKGTANADPRPMTKGTANADPRPMTKSSAGQAPRPPWKGGARPRVALLVKRTSWQVYIDKKEARLARLVKSSDPAIARMRGSHEEHTKTVAEVEQALAAFGAEVEHVGRGNGGFDASGFDLVITVGGDGTLLRASHSVLDTPILAINSAPSHSVGFFCGARSGEAAAAIRRALRGSLKRAVLTRMKVTVNGEPVAARILNDALLCHVSPAATSRYVLRWDDIEEEQKSSGIWIGPAAGSTAAQRSAGGKVLPLASKRLQLVVREAYTPHGGRYRLAHALIPPGDKLTVRSKMHSGKIFFDGPENAVQIGFGDVVEFCRAEESLILLGISPRRKWGER